MKKIFHIKSVEICAQHDNNNLIFFKVMNTPSPRLKKDTISIEIDKVPFLYSYQFKKKIFNQN